MFVALLHGTCVGEVNGLTEGALCTYGLAHRLYMTNLKLYKGNVALLHGIYVGEVDGLTECAFGA